MPLGLPFGLPDCPGFHLVSLGGLPYPTFLSVFFESFSLSPFYVVCYAGNNTVFCAFYTAL